MLPETVSGNPVSPPQRIHKFRQSKTGKANRMSREQVIRVVSDLTGTAYEGAEIPPVKLSVNGKSATLDLTPDEVKALESLVAEKDSGPLRKLLAPAAPAPVRKGKGKGSHSGNDENTAIREWWGTPEGRKATDHGDKPIPNRGRIPAEVREAYAKRAAK
jgi:hypothetical protein